MVAVETAENCGIVGAGGAGFPLAEKLKARVETFIVNAAECEPLLHKDKELLQHHTADILAGLGEGMKAVGASKGVIGIKAKYSSLIEEVQKSLPSNVSIHPLPDIYPVGDEFVLVYEITGKIIPPGGLPLQVGAVVSNVETLLNLGRGRVVARKFLSVVGAVASPRTLEVPVGISFGEAIQAAGGSLQKDSRVLVGGVMMGRLAESLEEPVTKTTGGLIVLPAGHPLVDLHSRDCGQSLRIGKSACDQCTFCTELCPRYLLGHPIQPHRAMKTLGFSLQQGGPLMGNLYCCECNLCSFISCPENLNPKGVAACGKAPARAKGLKWEGTAEDLKVHPLRYARRTPTHRLFQKLGLGGFLNEAPLKKEAVLTRKVTLPLKQHVGVPASPLVSAGQRVNEGDLVASVPRDKLGAGIHASISGVVKSVGDQIVIEAA